MRCCIRCWTCVRGLRIGRRFTHVFVMDVPGVEHPLLVTDAAINIAPDPATKVDIAERDRPRALARDRDAEGGAAIKVVETGEPAIPSSIDARLR